MKKYIAALLIVGLLALPFTAQAIIPVLDEAALAQMFVEMGFWLEDLAMDAEKIANQVLQIEQGVIMLENWAISLKNLEFSSLPILGGPIAAMLDAFHAAENVFFNAALIKDRFDELYSPFHTDLMPSFDYFSKAFNWNDAVRTAHWTAMQQQAHLTLSFESTTGAMEQALLHSEAALGHLEAQQAGNQLLGTQIAQQNETNALLGTLAHGQSIRDMNEAAAQDQALMRLEYVMEGWTEWTKTEGLSALPGTLK
jgi:P-type conjugative transfer protein TrbJ